jgi:hypothetical protein
MNPEKPNNPEQEPESIKCAAVIVRGEVFEGRSHVEAVNKAIGKFPDWMESPGDDTEDGYMTTHGRFVERKEGLEIARQAGQLEDPESKQRGANLTVEDLKK